MTRCEQRAGIAVRRGSAARRRDGKPREPEAALEAILLARGDAFAAARAARHPSASGSGSTRVVDQRPPATRAEARPHQHGSPAGADRGAAAPEPACTLKQSVDLARPRLDGDELCAALDDERLVEVVAAVHLEREAAELAQSVFAEQEQRTALAAKVTRRRRGGPAGEEGHRASG